MKIKKLWSFLLIILISFYLLPLMIKNTGSGMLVLLIALPVISFICSSIYGLKNGFQPLFSILLVVLYIPSVFLIYNSSAMIYALIYGVLSFIGMYIGSRISKKWGSWNDRKRKDDKRTCLLSCDSPIGIR